MCNTINFLQFSLSGEHIEYVNAASANCNVVYWNLCYTAFVCCYCFTANHIMFGKVVFLQWARMFSEFFCSVSPLKIRIWTRFETLHEYKIYAFAMITANRERDRKICCVAEQYFTWKFIKFGELRTLWYKTEIVYRSESIWISLISSVKFTFLSVRQIYLMKFPFQLDEKIKGNVAFY